MVFLWLIIRFSLVAICSVYFLNIMDIHVVVASIWLSRSRVLSVWVHVIDTTIIIGHELCCLIPTPKVNVGNLLRLIIHFILILNWKWNILLLLLTITPNTLTISNYCIISLLKALMYLFIQLATIRAIIIHFMLVYRSMLSIWPVSVCLNILPF